MYLPWPWCGNNQNRALSLKKINSIPPLVALPLPCSSRAAAPAHEGKRVVLDPAARLTCLTHVELWSAAALSAALQLLSRNSHDLCSPRHTQNPRFGHHLQNLRSGGIRPFWPNLSERNPLVQHILTRISRRMVHDGNSWPGAFGDFMGPRKGFSERALQASRQHRTVPGAWRRCRHSSRLLQRCS